MKGNSLTTFGFGQFAPVTIFAFHCYRFPLLAALMHHREQRGDICWYDLWISILQQGILLAIIVE